MKRRILSLWMVVILGIAGGYVSANEADDLKAKAEKGDASAQLNLGLMYRDGDGVLQDYVAAHMWFNIASANGDRFAREQRNSIVELMTMDQIAEAQKKAAEWMQGHNNSAPPPQTQSVANNRVDTPAPQQGGGGSVLDFYLNNDAGNSKSPEKTTSENIYSSYSPAEFVDPVVPSTQEESKVGGNENTPQEGSGDIPWLETADSGEANDQTSLAGGGAGSGSLPAKDNMFTDCEGCPQMITLSPGSYERGNKYGPKDTRPRHDITIGYSFAIGVFEVTIANWEQCIMQGGCSGYRPYDSITNPDLPVTNVSWEDAKSYIAWISQKTGKKYRLPTEAEWEYAARAGTTTRFSWGDSLKKGKNTLKEGDEVGGEVMSKGGFKLSIPIANINPNGKGIEPVGKYVANPWGLYDVHGNVWEWTEDCYNHNYSKTPKDGSARTDNCSAPYQRVTRGGLKMSNLKLHITESKTRDSLGLKNREFNIGFRVVREN